MSYDNELYQQVILDHNRNPRNFREIKNASHHCHGINPLCGDDFTVYVDLDADAEVIQDISFVGTGCAISKSSSSLMTTFLKGKKLEEARALSPTQRLLLALQLSDTCLELQRSCSTKH